MLFLHHTKPALVHHVCDPRLTRRRDLMHLHPMLQVFLKVSTLCAMQSIYAILMQSKSLNTYELPYDMDIVLDPSEPGKEVNNLAANIISRFVVQVSEQTVFVPDTYHFYKTYKDHWLTREERKTNCYTGIQDNIIRKITSDLKATIDNQSVPNLTLRNILPLHFCTY